MSGKPTSCLYCGRKPGDIDDRPRNGPVVTRMSDEHVLKKTWPKRLPEVNHAGTAWVWFDPATGKRERKQVGTSAWNIRVPRLCAECNSRSDVLIEQPVEPFIFELANGDLDAATGLSKEQSDLLTAWTVKTGVMQAATRPGIEIPAAALDVVRASMRLGPLTAFARLASQPCDVLDTWFFESRMHLWQQVAHVHLIAIRKVALLSVVSFSRFAADAITSDLMGRFDTGSDAPTTEEQYVAMAQDVLQDSYRYLALRGSSSG